MERRLYYLGKPVKELNKAELVKALEEISQELEHLKRAMQRQGLMSAMVMLKPRRPSLKDKILKWLGV